LWKWNSHTWNQWFAEYTRDRPDSGSGSGSARDTTRGIFVEAKASPPESPDETRAPVPAKHDPARRASHASDVASDDAKPSPGTPLPPVHPAMPSNAYAAYPTNASETRRVTARRRRGARAARGDVAARIGASATRAWGCDDAGEAGRAEDTFLDIDVLTSRGAGRHSAVADVDCDERWNRGRDG
jgi:hypothetical protein